MTSLGCQLLTIAAFAVAAVHPSLTIADQHATALPHLFEQLENSADPETARRFEQEIWRLWLEGPTENASNNLSSARLAMSAGDLEQAENVLTTLINVVPKFAEAWNQRALLWFLSENYSAALRDIEATLALEPRHFGALSGRGQIYLRMNQPEAALAAFEQALTIHPWIADVTRNTEVLKAYLNGKNRGI